MILEKSPPKLPSLVNLRLLFSYLLRIAPPKHSNYSAVKNIDGNITSDRYDPTFSFLSAKMLQNLTIIR